MTGYDAHAVDRLIGEAFRFHGAVVATGDEVARPFGLSSARWQVMGAIEATGGATASELARRAGVTRQSIQRIVSEMAAEGYLELLDNPRHRRARTVAMTAKGWAAYRAVTDAWKPMAERMDRRFGVRVLESLAARLAELHDDLRASATPGRRSDTRKGAVG